MICKMLVKKSIALILLALYSLPTLALEKEIIQIKKNEPSPYSGVLMPEDNFYDYESCMAEKQACVDSLDRIHQPINLSYIKTDTYVKIGIGALSFGLCTVFATNQSGSNFFGSVVGCGAGVSIMTLAYIFD